MLSCCYKLGFSAYSEVDLALEKASHKSARLLIRGKSIMLHAIYIIAFTILAFLAVTNLIRNLMTLGIDSQKRYGSPRRYSTSMGELQSASHPELLDESGNFVNEPYLVMRSISVEDAREQLDALYKASPGSSDEAHDEA
jgi:hypothetical protein